MKASEKSGVKQEMILTIILSCMGEIFAFPTLPFRLGKIYNQLYLQRKCNSNRNNWVVPTYMVSVEDAGLRGGGSRLKQKIWNAARETISEWTGQELTECSLYGIRVYKEGGFPR